VVKVASIRGGGAEPASASSSKTSTRGVAKAGGNGTVRGASPASRPARSGFAALGGKSKKKDEEREAPKRDYRVEEIRPDDKVTFIEAGHR
jgi:hypothetical protein